MIIILTMFGLSILLVQLSNLLYRWFLPRHCQRWRTTRHYNLHKKIGRQISWIKRLNMVYLSRYNILIQQYQLWVFKQGHGWKYEFLRKKREIKQDPIEFLPEPVVDNYGQSGGRFTRETIQSHIHGGLIPK
jgi:hypothetical protein